MDYPDGVAKGKPTFYARVFDRLVGGSIMGMWCSIFFLGAVLHVGDFCWPPLHPEADS